MKEDFQVYHDRFNALPFETRSIAADSELASRIRDLEYLKTRLKENYVRELKWVNARIKSYKGGLTKILNPET
jgi:hypothetical protein